MATVHVFVSAGRFKTFEEIRAYIDQTYDDDGDSIPSLFMREVGLSDYEPGCIEAIDSQTGFAVPTRELLADASFSDHWLSSVPNEPADAGICVFAPNRVAHPERSSLKYLGEFSYQD